MVTCGQIHALGKSVEEENEKRKNVNLPESHQASFFHCKQYNVGAHSTTWGGDLKELYIWVYTRTESPGFLCPNPKCKIGNTVCTSFLGNDGNIIDTCIYCKEHKRKPSRILQKVENEESRKLRPISQMDWRLVNPLIIALVQTKVSDIQFNCQRSKIRRAERNKWVILSNVSLKLKNVGK